ncbi:MAG: hypothetical protein JW849_07620 [Phycisphaerae bacterium]|nr:hypothetical protein [Phycisphaerae bacterium]
MQIEKYSMGIGDRFAHQGKAQLQAMIQAQAAGATVAPVWNKSHREHTIIHTAPASVRAEADAAVKALGWKEAYHVDADHIGLKNVDLFLDASDFFTLDVADFTGQAAGEDDIRAFVEKYSKYAGELAVPGIDETFHVTKNRIEDIAAKYLLAVREAGKIYRHVEGKKGKGNFITEVSMDETDNPQTPEEMFFILAAVADEGIPAQTIAPKFTGRFNKGVDYVGDVAQFAKEFQQDIAVIAFAIREFGLPANLKLSVHSGSDKFSIYGPIREAIRKFGAGLHLKTAGTTWLEELIGLAEAGGQGLAIAKDVYAAALGRFDELCGPYATVIDIDRNKLPSAEIVAGWGGQDYAAALRHDQACDAYNPNFRQLLHVGYKVAAEMGERYLDALKEFEEVIAKNVTENILERHLKRIFL